MADPKYANLYGIACDQPDVYETNDVSEVDELSDIYEEDSKSVERLHISAPEAFSKFQGKVLDGENVDFSDWVHRQPFKNGYDYRTSHWELMGAGNENPAEKLKRLKLETEQLIQEVSQLPERPKAFDITDSLSDITKESSLLLEKIAQIKIKDLFGTNVMQDATDPSGVNLVQLQHKLENLAVESVANDNAGERQREIVPQEDSTIIKYQFKLKPNQTLLTYTSRVAELEHRLSKLETLLGYKSGQLARLCELNVEENGLLSCSQWMIAKLSLLDSTQLDAIETRAIAVNTRLDQLAEKSNNGSLGLLDPEKEKRINELYDLSGKARELSEIVPNMLERMTALESLHQQGKQCVETLSHLEALQNEVVSTLNNNEKSLKNIEDSLKVNVEAIKNSVDSLQKRMDALVKQKK